jgi:glycosyltransferase involved in cell wall biosynthesis
MSQLLASPELRAAMGAAGRARAQRMFSLDRMAEEMERVYLELVDPQP